VNTFHPSALVRVNFHDTDARFSLTMHSSVSHKQSHIICFLFYLLSTVPPLPYVTVHIKTVCQQVLKTPQTESKKYTDLEIN